MEKSKCFRPLPIGAPTSSDDLTYERHGNHSFQTPSNRGTYLLCGKEKSDVDRSVVSDPLPIGAPTSSKW